jgi:hypothetical protein
MLRGRVASFFERLGQGEIFRLQARQAVGYEHAGFAILILAEAFLELHRRQMADWRGDADAGRILADEDA